MGNLDAERVEHIVQKILNDYSDDRAINKTDLYNQPDNKSLSKKASDRLFGHRSLMLPDDFSDLLIDILFRPLMFIVRFFRKKQ